MISSLRELGLLSARYAEEEALRAASKIVSDDSSNRISPLVTKPDDSDVKTETPAVANSATIVSVPVPASGSSPTTLPSSPTITQSPPTLHANIDSSASIPASVPPASVPAPASSPASIIQILPGQNPSFPAMDKLQQIGLSFLPIHPFTSLATAQGGLLIPTPLGMGMGMGFTTLPTLAPTLPTSLLAAAPNFSSPPLPPAPQPPTAAAAVTNTAPTAQYTPGGASLEVFSSLANSRVRKPFHKRRPAHMDKNMLFCHFCGRKDTPEWRKGPSGPATLCNACGLQWAKKVRAQRSSGSGSSSSSSPSSSSSTNKTNEPKTNPVESCKTSEETTSDTEAVKVES